MKLDTRHRRASPEEFRPLERQAEVPVGGGILLRSAPACRGIRPPARGRARGRSGRCTWRVARAAGNSCAAPVSPSSAAPQPAGTGSEREHVVRGLLRSCRGPCRKARSGALDVSRPRATITRRAKPAASRSRRPKRLDIARQFVQSSLVAKEPEMLAGEEQGNVGALGSTAGL